MVKAKFPAESIPPGYHVSFVDDLLEDPLARKELEKWALAIVAADTNNRLKKINYANLTLAAYIYSLEVQNNEIPFVQRTFKGNFAVATLIEITLAKLENSFFTDLYDKSIWVHGATTRNHTLIDFISYLRDQGYDAQVDHVISKYLNNKEIVKALELSPHKAEKKSTSSFSMPEGIHVGATMPGYDSSIQYTSPKKSITPC